jgi:tetratricopeptide (TPR) repeat protein
MKRETAAPMSTSARVVLGAFCVAVLALLGYCTHERNKVWHTPESLWRDAVEKSPGNGRAWMNLGVGLMARGDYRGALDSFERAERLLPLYPLVHINLGICLGAMGREAESASHYERAIALAPQDGEVQRWYSAWAASRPMSERILKLYDRAVAECSHDKEDSGGCAARQFAAAVREIR